MGEKVRTMAKQNMIVTCHKCGKQWESDIELMDGTACPNCGKHGQITSSNSKVLKLQGIGTVLVPAN